MRGRETERGEWKRRGQFLGTKADRKSQDDVLGVRRHQAPSSDGSGRLSLGVAGARGAWVG